MGKIRGLDAIRFVCALWVVVGHSELTFPFGHQESSLALKLLFGALHSLVFGVSAVMIFFLISGFCIHYPFRHSEKPHWGEYFGRRYVRIGIPLLGAIVLVRVVKGDIIPILWVIWSLYAEIIYYTLYPLLMALKRRIGWSALFAGSAFFALAIIVSDPQVDSIQNYGILRAWIIGLPVWLMGCRLAEEADSLPAARVPRLWLWRGAIWLASCLYGILHFHARYAYGGYCWTLLLFSLLAFFWLRQEIRHFRFQAPPAFLEKAGVWSYSLYLTHNFAFWLSFQLHFVRRGSPLSWFLQLTFALALAYVFFLLVERPSHLLARRFKQKDGPDVPLTDEDRKTPLPERAPVG